MHMVTVQILGKERTQKYSIIHFPVVKIKQKNK